ncbi:MAG: class I SAM-dependent methyltransferase [Pseudoalteromonas tunicata]|nr:class I SAM-dependent methyltransferase [Pseudoalteromonas tunicata]AXT31358.1 methyltransferase [Pseudoalteromonas tunicata]MDP4984092.1 class I SAM-dependent methyltransferase [Pseudoalteromonas tunicata]
MKMTLRFNSLLIGAATLALSACTSSNMTELLSQTSQSSLRSSENIARDQYRHPIETLTFFGLQPNMNVVEIWPGNGWYTELLAPALRNEGTYYAAHFPADSEVKYYQRAVNNFNEKLSSNNAFSDVVVTEFYPGTHHAIAPANSVDMVLTFRNLHNWYIQHDLEGVDNAFAAFYSALKPGGILGVVDHRLPENRDERKAKRSGYVKESWVIALAQKAGFEFVAKSEINANPLDTADHEKGVWTLPPRLALGEQDTEKYRTIGESDRMTLKFRKPDNK